MEGLMLAREGVVQSATAETKVRSRFPATQRGEASYWKRLRIRSLCYLYGIVPTCFIMDVVQTVVQVWHRRAV